MKTLYASIFRHSALTAALLISFVSTESLRAESLWPANRSKSLISNKVASQRGDILTVVVDQSTTVSNTANTQTNKESEIDNQVNQFLFSAAASGFGTHNGELPATDIDGNNEYNGGGSITNTSSIGDRFSVMVADVLPNGNLVIEGSRKLAYSREYQYVVFSGVIRYWDLQADNTISSDLVHNMSIEYISEGTITSAQEKGWLEKLNEIVNPF